MSNTAILPSQLAVLDEVMSRPQPQPRRQAQPHTPSYRLTRRGRLVVFALALGVLVAIGVAFAGGSVATDEKFATETIVVAPGDTLWEIASSHAESGDVRSMMRFLEDLNSLDSVVLAAGQRLRVPVE